MNYLLREFKLVETGQETVLKTEKISIDKLDEPVIKTSHLFSYSDQNLLGASQTVPKLIFNPNQLLVSLKMTSNINCTFALKKNH